MPTRPLLLGPLGTSGGAPGGAGDRLGVSHRVVCPHPPPVTRARVLIPQVPGGRVWGRGPEPGRTPPPPPPLLQPLPWPLCDPRPPLPPRVTGTACSEGRGLSAGRSRRTACLQLPGWQLGGGRDRGFHMAAVRWIHSSGHWAGTLWSWGLTTPGPSVEVLERPGAGTAMAAGWRAPGRGQERGRGARDWIWDQHPRGGVPMPGTQRNHVYLSACPDVLVLSP